MRSGLSRSNVKRTEYHKNEKTFKIKKKKNYFKKNGK